MASSAQISPKQALNYTIIYNIQERPKKWPNQKKISGKPLQKANWQPCCQLCCAREKVRNFQF